MIGHRLVVVADAHIGAGSASREDALVAFLDSVPALGDALLIGGDLYDFWFTYRRLIPRDSIRVTAAIVTLARRMPVLMLGGNHDRWGDTFWSAETGIKFDPRRLRFKIGGRDVVAVHGDGLHEERRSAGFLNRILDTRGVVATFDFLPPALGFAIARRLGHDPGYGAAHPEVVASAAARQESWAKRELASDPSIGALVMGHTHRAALSEVEPQRWYVNPGPWLNEQRYAVIDDSGVRLEVFR